MSLRVRKYREEMQRSLRLEPISEALPVTLVIARLVAIAFTIIAVKMFHFIKYRHYFDDLVTYHRENLTRKYVIGLLFFEMPLTTFPYNFTVALLAYKLIKRYNELIDGTVKAIESLAQLLNIETRQIYNTEVLESRKIPMAPIVALLAYNAFLRFLILFPILLYLDIKTAKGCNDVAKAINKGASLVVERGANVVIVLELTKLSRGEHPTLRISVGTAILTLIANVVLSIPAAVRMHKIIRRVNTTLRLCRYTVNSIASGLVTPL